MTQWLMSGLDYTSTDLCGMKAVRDFSAIASVEINGHSVFGPSKYW